ncbi:MAG TPA: hypothetical protein VHO70_05515, partial [Chitinispirillaceae bacterium]|nr:hypothetical protein [Chitinispirillaceae bacterium]
MSKHIITFPILFLLFLSITISAQTYACSMLSISMKKNGTVKKKSFAVNSLYINFATDSVKVFGNYEGRYLSNVFKVTRRNYDTLFVSGGLLGDDKKIYLLHRNNTVISNYNFISDAGESSISVYLTLKSLQNHFSENYHEKKEMQQSPSHPRDLLGREQK